MQNIESLLSMTRNPDNMNLVYRFGLSKDWILIDQSGIVYEKNNLDNDMFSIYDIYCDQEISDIEKYEMIDSYITRITHLNIEIQNEIENSKKKIEEIKKSIMQKEN